MSNKLLRKMSLGSLINKLTTAERKSILFCAMFCQTNGKFWLIVKNTHERNCYNWSPFNQFCQLSPELLGPADVELLPGCCCSAWAISSSRVTGTSRCCSAAATEDAVSLKSSSSASLTSGQSLRGIWMVWRL